MYWQYFHAQHKFSAKHGRLAWVAFSFIWYSHRRARLEICGRHSLENQSAPGAVLEIAEADKNSMEFMYNIEAYKEHL